ncbi:MAG: protease inhibitor I42 family protein [Gaiellaceae bacterium MAG52_C11]|nr:protease inhibitor I42 family protein [Candidatus Gaiellasilicea maunaloa]
MWLLRIIPLFIVVVLVGVPAATSASTDSTPIGPLPKGPVTTIETARGSLVAVALPRQNPSTGLVWRVARPVDTRVLRQISEADVGASVVLVFRATGTGKASIRLGLTRGESSGKALRSATYHVRAR